MKFTFLTGAIYRHSLERRVQPAAAARFGGGAHFVHDAAPARLDARPAALEADVYAAAVRMDLHTDAPTEASSA